jgi:SAM-dependent methyltransferase
MPTADYEADLRYPLRIDSDAVDGIFTEHTLEHLGFPDGLRLLRECHRVLKPGGVLRIVVPDVELFLTHYCAGDQQWFDAWEKLMFSESADPQRRRRVLSSPMEAISFVTQEYGHLSAWDFRTLTCYLERAGFVDILRVGFRAGSLRELLLDQDEDDRKFVSLYVEAVK